MAPYKVRDEIQEFIVTRKRENPRLSCRKFVSLIEERFSVTLSKSSINSILKHNALSSPIGRPRKKPRSDSRLQAIGARIPELLKLIENKEFETKARGETEEKAELAAKAKAEAEERVRIADAQAKAAVEAGERKRREAEEAEKARLQAQQQVEAEEKIRQEAEARKKAEELARAEAEARAKAEERAQAEAKARLEAEERIRQVEEKARVDAQERLKSDAEERVRMESEIKKRIEAEVEARLEAERKAKIERYKLEAREEVRFEAEPPKAAQHIVNEEVTSNEGVVWSSEPITKNIDIFSSLGCYLLKIIDLKRQLNQFLAAAIAQQIKVDTPIVKYFLEYYTYEPLFKDNNELARFLGEQVPEAAFEHYKKEMSKLDIISIQRELVQAGFDPHKANNFGNICRDNLQRLNSEVQSEFFPSVYQFLDVKTMFSRFYCLPGRLEHRPGLLLIKLFYRPDFAWINDLVWQEDFSYAVTKINSNGIMTPQGERIVLEDRISAIESGFF